MLPYASARWLLEIQATSTLLCSITPNAGHLLMLQAHMTGMVYKQNKTNAWPLLEQRVPTMYIDFLKGAMLRNFRQFRH